MSKVSFKTGTKAKCTENPVEGAIYFATDTQEIILNGTSYGDSVESSKFTSGVDSGKITLTTTADRSLDLPLPGATGTTAGLMSAKDKKDVGEMKEVLYTQFATVTCTSPTSVIEKGVNTSVTITWDFKFNGVSAVPDTMMLKNGSTVLVNDKTVKTYTESIDSTTTYTATAEKKYGTTSTDKVTKSASKTISAYYPKYFGSSAKTTITSADITGMSKQTISSTAAGTYSVNVANDGEYVWWCVPSPMSINKITLGGFAVPFQPAATVEVTNKGNYKCYRSTNPLSAGTRSFVIS